MRPDPFSYPWARMVWPNIQRSVTHAWESNGVAQFSLSTGRRICSTAAACLCCMLVTGDGRERGERRAIPPDQREHTPDGHAHGVRARQLWQPRPGNKGIGLTAPASPFFLLLQAVSLQFINEDVNSLSFPSINCAEVRIADLETFCLLKCWGQSTVQFYLT
jgi:hypothetical protein